MVRGRRRTGARIAASVVLVLALGVAWSQDTLAVFTAPRSVGAATFTSAGGIQLTMSPTSALVSYGGMLPGDAVTNSVVVTNAASIQLRYAISSSATNPDSKGLKDQLTLVVKTVDATTPGTPCDDFDGTQLYTGDLDSTTGNLVGDNAQGAQAGDRTLDGSASETLCFQAALPSATADSYAGATTTATFTLYSEQTANN